MLLDNIDYSKKHDFTLLLTKKNKKPICILNEAYNRNLERNLDTFDKLSFTIPKYIEDSITHEQKENPNYEKVMVENMVLLKCGEASSPIFQSYFIIKNITESSDQTIKTVECSSREVMLNKNTITINDIERQLKKDEVNISDGVFDILEQECTWKLGYLQDSAKVEHLNGGTNNKYRWFDALSKPIYQFLSEDVSQAFNVLITYDTLNKLINVYDRDNYGTHTGIILSEENYIKNLNKKISSEGIVTKLEVTGRDELTFEDVNILGTTYILNYDYYINNGQMSDELVTALGKYDVLLNAKNTEFQNLKGQIDILNTDLMLRQGELTALNEELKALRILQSTYMSEGNNIDLPTATTNVNNKVIAIANKNSEITSLKTQISSLNTQITQIAYDINKKNAKDTNNVLIFNADLLEELEDFTYTEYWSNNYYSNSQQLYNAAKDILKDWSVPPIEFELDLVDLFAIAKAQNYWEKIIKLGDLVRVYSSVLKTNTDVRIVGYSYNIDSNDLKVSFSNKNSKLDDKRGIASAVKKATESSKVVNTKKLKWNEIKDTKNAVDQFLNNALDTAKQNIISQVGKNKINIDENGIFVINADNEDNQIAILSGIIGFTDDGWQTCNTCLDNSGLYAEYLVGQIILGEQLFIADETGQLNITGSLMTIKDDQNNVRVRLGKYTASAWGLQILSKNGGQVILDENGLLSQYTMAMAENVDENHPLRFKFYVPDNMISVYKINLAFTLEAYRAYETGAANGGASTETSGSSSTSTSGGGGYQSGSALVNETVEPTWTNTYLNTQNAVPDDYWADGKTHQHTISKNELSHTHVFGVQLDDHTHNIDHTHSVEIPDHTHGLVYKIIEGTVAQNVCVYVDGELRDGSNYNSNQNNVELTSFITTSGWHEISLTSSQNGRLSASLYVSIFLGA